MLMEADWTEKDQTFVHNKKSEWRNAAVVVAKRIKCRKAGPFWRKPNLRFMMIFMKNVSISKIRGLKGDVGIFSDFIIKNTNNAQK